LQHQTVIVVAGGAPPHPGALELLPDDAPVVAADGGLDHALALGLRVDLAVGDFDSASEAAVAAAAASGTRVERYPEAKDATDLELALDAAAGLGPRRVVVLGALEGRLDHLLAALLSLGAPRYAGFELDALFDQATVQVIHSERVLQGRRGELVSLLPVHGRAEGVTTEGLVYPLRGETLSPGSSRGVSNVFAAAEARVTLERGVLLAVRPGPEGAG
jgi:thiamine pyrophosphokinase